jgi:salicylate hydroxylase
MKKVAIIGAGISGLFIANLFKRNPNYRVTIYEKNTSISLDEGYGVQLSVNGIKFLNNIGFEKFYYNEKFNPEKINFYSTQSSRKICELDITEFNTKSCKYTTLRRSTLIKFLKKDLGDLIKTDFNISKIDQQKKQIKINFENNETVECDFLIISDGVFSKSKNLLLNKIIKPKYNGTLAIRGILTKPLENIDNKNISLLLHSDFHQVIYPTNSSKDLNFIAIMKYHLSTEDQKNYSLFSNNTFIEKVLQKIPLRNKKFLDNLKELKIFPVFVSNKFYKTQNKNIHLIGDAFFAFPPSFAQGASQSLEGAFELFKNIENNTQDNFFENRVNKTKMINIRSKFNQFAFHLSSPLTRWARDFFLKRLVKNKKFLESYLGKVYRN